MGKKLMLAVTLLLSLVAAQVQSARATTFLRLESSYLGDGWFQYHVTVYNDPFFSAAYLTGFAVGFTNPIARPDVAEWEPLDGTSFDPNWSHTNYPARPNETTFLVRSSEPGYRTVTPTNGPCALVLMMLWPREFDPAVAGGFVTANLVGYANLPCLVPCDAAHSDGSPTNLVYEFKWVKDIDITRLVQTNGEIHGLEFSWDTAATFVLQGTENFTDWTNISYLWSYPPQTVWTTNQSLNDYGRCFRLSLVASHQTTNLPPLAKSLLMTKTKAAARPVTVYPRIASCLPKKDKVEVTIETTDSQSCVVQAMDSHRHVILQKRVKVRGKTATVVFDAAKLPTAVLFQVSTR